MVENPLLSFFALFGSTSGQICAFLSGQPWKDIYSGLTGFNSLLVAQACGFVFTKQDTLLKKLLVAFGTGKLLTKKYFVKLQKFVAWNIPFCKKLYSGRR